MKPLGLFCRLSVSSAAGESHSFPKMLAIPLSDPQPPAGPSYSTASSSRSAGASVSDMIRSWNAPPATLEPLTDNQEPGSHFRQKRRSGRHLQAEDPKMDF